MPSGGHFIYGIQGTKTIGNNFELFMRVGATNGQTADVNAILPYYMQFGLIKKFSSK